jgi:[ribosomal protein S5]-alanine N-acetyltransferase
MKPYSIQIETDRLILREMQVQDGEDFYNLNADPEVLKYTGDVAFKSISESKEFLVKYPSISYNKDGYGRWTCVEKLTKQIIGWCGLRLQETGEVDLGYRFHKRFWGQGFATESSIASLDLGFKNLKLEVIIARASKDNIGSWKVMEKLGMKFRNEEFFHGQAGYVYKITRNQWLERHA